MTLYEQALALFADGETDQAVTDVLGIPLHEVQCMRTDYIYEGE